MKQTIKLLAAGLLPLAAGWALNFAILHLSFVPLLLTNLILLILWGILSYALSSPERNPALQALLLCGVGVLMLALVLYQELVMGEYWTNLIGLTGQMYFLPTLTLSFTIFQLFPMVIRLWPCYIVCWIFMYLASLIGSWRKTRR